MSLHLPTTPSQVFQQRRRRVAGSTAGPCLVFAGMPRPRNYAANVFPYRTESHFLYLTGAAIPGAVLWLEGERARLFVPEATAQDALWHGPAPSSEAIRAATGVDEVCGLAQLAAHTDLRAAATLPATDPQARAVQCRLLGRAWNSAEAPEESTWTPADLALADAIIAARLRHDDAALTTMRGAAAITTRAFRAGVRATIRGVREAHVRAAMEAEILAAGATCAYGSIVTVAGEVLHNDRHDRTLADGDLLLADVGAELEGWASDVTRTWPVSGAWSATQATLYDLVLQAQRDAIAAVTPGRRYRDIHLAASITLARGLVDEGILKGNPESLVERGAHALFFPHGIGHLLGLDVHDMEDLGDRAGYAPGRLRSAQFGLGYLRLDRDLEPGMAVTIEPGLYFVPAILDAPELAGPFVADGTLDRAALERFRDVRGIRIEDDVLCTPQGPEVLTAAIPKARDELASWARA